MVTASAKRAGQLGKSTWQWDSKTTKGIKKCIEIQRTTLFFFFNPYMYPDFELN